MIIRLVIFSLIGSASPALALERATLSAVVESDSSEDTCDKTLAELSIIAC